MKWCECKMVQCQNGGTLKWYNDQMMGEENGAMTNRWNIKMVILLSSKVWFENGWSEGKTARW